MKQINVDVVPKMDTYDINGEAVAMAVVDAGVLIQYLIRDRAVLVEWADIVDFGLTEPHKLSHKLEESTAEPEEIPGPTGAG